MKYEEPIIEIMKMEMCDIICSSFGNNSDIENGDEEGGFAPK